jgi:hypothetical protein
MFLAVPEDPETQLAIAGLLGHIREPKSVAWEILPAR